MRRPLIKYCGNKSFEDVKVVAKTKADYIGFIFANSKRKVRPTDVKQWLQEIVLGEKQIVGIFVNADLDEIEAVSAKVPLSVIQCHGTESVNDIKLIKEKTGRKVWKVIHHEEKALQKMKQFAGVTDGYVIDTKIANMWGGSGVSFDWDSIPLYQQESRNQGVPCFIAGGINPDNITNLLSYKIDGFDISSGIEHVGMKDHRIIQKIEKRVDKFAERSK